jgi:hypothetical protein
MKRLDLTGLSPSTAGCAAPCTQGTNPNKHVVDRQCRWRCRSRGRFRACEALREGERDPLDDGAGVQVHHSHLTATSGRTVALEEDDVPVACRQVGPGEERVGRERAPRPADQAQAAELVGRQPEQDVAQHAVVHVERSKAVYLSHLLSYSMCVA